LIATNQAGCSGQIGVWLSAASGGLAAHDFNVPPDWATEGDTSFLEAEDVHGGVMNVVSNPAPLRNFCVQDSAHDVQPAQAHGRVRPDADTRQAVWNALGESRHVTDGRLRDVGRG
jgi:hypothetical protein